ncbi:hypothetical protein [Streptomyces millisiae]|uniref:Barstar (barnase inhibitor) domain-containing protein n=1 Tax=Streptomyces millisiae TaxID=3075542 RepID=A0ABU2LWA0_9ACTN|nr:hypothetical protein [Streptomyces sp. DSM 44918]MDT0321877.1 hypothetical protein [Streptomyces sp. DSM 44918]
MPEAEWWTLISQAPGVFGDQFDRVAWWFEGYADGARRHGGGDLDGFEEWLIDQTGRTCAFGWRGLILHRAGLHCAQLLNLAPTEQRCAITVLTRSIAAFLNTKTSDKPRTVPRTVAPPDATTPLCDGEGELDTHLAIHGVTRYHSRETLRQTVRWLAGRGYRMVHLDAGHWSGHHDLHRAVARSLDIIEHHDAQYSPETLRDHLRSAISRATAQGVPGTAIVLTDYDTFATTCPDLSQTLLEIITREAHYAAVTGGRAICLLHTDDPDKELGPVGARPIEWNPDEHPSSGRRLADSHRIDDPTQALFPTGDEPTESSP